MKENNETNIQNLETNFFSYFDILVWVCYSFFRNKADYTVDTIAHPRKGSTLFLGKVFLKCFPLFIEIHPDCFYSSHVMVTELYSSDINRSV